MRGRWIGLVAAGAAAAALAAAPAQAQGAAVAYQADVAHSGFVPDGLNPPLGIKWVRRDLGTNVSYPVIAEGRVFVTAVTGTSSSSSSSETGPTLLYALDRRTGGTVWVREVAAGGSPAYDNGRLYVLGQGALDAVSAATGERLWRLEMERAGGAAPVPDGPFVYASDEDGAYAVSADTGLVLQTVSIPNSGFAVVGDRVFLAAGGCAQLAAYTRGLAQQVWERSGCATSTFSAPASPAFHSIERTVPFERLWAREFGGQRGIVVDALTSLGTEQFGSVGGLAFGGELAFLRGQKAVEARHVESGVIKWRWDAPAETSLVSSALAVRDAVWTVTYAGDLVALGRGDGQERFRTKLVGGPVGSSGSPSSSGTARVHEGMAADGEGLVVPTRDRVVGLGAGGDTPGVLDPDKQPGSATTMTTTVEPRDVIFGGKTAITGEVNRTNDSYPDDQVELQVDPYPYGVWENAGTLKTENGRFSFSHRPDRNTRYRVVDTSTAPAVIGREFQVYVDVKYRLRLGYRGRGRIYLAATLGAPDYLNLAKQKLYVYRLRSRRSVGVRIGAIPFKRLKGTSYRAARTLRVPSHRPRTDYFYICIKLKDTRQITRLNGRKWGCGRARF